MSAQELRALADALHTWRHLMRKRYGLSISESSRAFERHGYQVHGMWWYPANGIGYDDSFILTDTHGCV